MTPEQGLENWEATRSQFYEDDWRARKVELAQSGRSWDPRERDSASFGSGSHGIRMHRITIRGQDGTWVRYWDAMLERYEWIDATPQVPAWKRDLERVRARLVAKGKLPKGAR